MAVCTSITKLEDLSGGIEILLVTIDEDIKAYMIFNYADSLQFLNQEVIVSYRKDIYQGKIETFINTLTIPVKVTTLDKEDNIKLYTEQTDNNSNVCIADLQYGQTMIGAILYCVASSYNSKNTVWMELKVRDRAGKISTLRLFDPESYKLRYDGIYIKANIKRSKWGLTSEAIAPMSLEFAPNPELKICRVFIERYFLEDHVMGNILDRTKLLDHMESHIDIELGYLLVRAAIEINILEGLKDVFKEVDFKAVSYAILMQYGYVTKEEAGSYSTLLKSITFTLQQKMPADTASKVLSILDVNEEGMEPTAEKRLFSKINDLAKEIINIRKGA